MRSQTTIGLTISFLLASQVALAQSSFEITDDNDDRQINKEEFYERIEKAGVFQTLDTNIDRRIDEDEFEQLEVPIVFSEWDADQDGYLNRRELYNGLYNYIDADSDGDISIYEWDDPGEQGWFGVLDDDL